MSIREQLRLFRERVHEYLMYDSIVVRFVMGFGGWVVSWILSVLGFTRQTMALLFGLHRVDMNSLANRRAEKMAHDGAQCAKRHQPHPVLSYYADFIRNYNPAPAVKKIFDNPTTALGQLALVLRSPCENQKGVLLLKYSYVFPLFARMFDINAIGQKYHLILEPAWSGYCDPNILSYSTYDFPVFIQAPEPRDANLILATNSNLVPLPTSSNWWIDHRMFRPLDSVEKDIDVVMVAGWGRFKRHAAFFRGLRRLRRAGHRLRVLLLGYPVDLSTDDLLQLAQHYGVADQLEIHEWVPYEKVNEYVNRAKVNLLWSRKEGFNRAMIECMLADVPCLLRAGHNYGYRYPYINEQTGAFADENTLADALLSMINQPGRFSPRQWVLANMSCQRAGDVISKIICETMQARGESWSGNIAIKVNQLHGMKYWNESDHIHFQPDYDFLRSTQNVGQLSKWHSRSSIIGR